MRCKERPSIFFFRIGIVLLLNILFWTHMRKQDNIADRVFVCQQHYQAVDADTDAGGGRHP